MTFEGQYLTYAEYLGLGGSAIGETSFNVLEFEARNQIDLRTHNRLVNESTIPQKVKICDFHLIEKIKGYIDAANSIGGNIASENTDGYSISYITVDKIKDLIVSKNVELEDIMISDLYGVIVNGEHVIYNGGV